MILSNRFKSEDARAMGGITLLLNTLEEVEEERIKTSDIGRQLMDMDISQKTKISSIIFTSGDRKANKLLINSLKELDLEQSDEFPHFETIKFLRHKVIACFFDAVGAHNRKIEEMRQNTINRALGSHTVLDDSKIYGKLLYKLNNKKKNKQKKLLQFKDDEVLDDNDSEFDDYDDEYEGE